MSPQQTMLDRLLAYLLPGAVLLCVVLFGLGACASAEAEADTDAAPAPYDAEASVQVIIEAEPNDPQADNPDDPREPWMGADAWSEAAQAVSSYVAEHPEPRNVQVLTGMSTGEIWNYMQQHVSGALGVGCQYCHDITDYGADPYPEKVTARLMMLLVRDANGQFVTSVPNWQGNYVQCATCHRGQPTGMLAYSAQPGTLPFDAYAIDPDYNYVAAHPATGTMLAMRDHMDTNWASYALPRREPIEEIPAEVQYDRMKYLTFDETIYAAANCYTCHAGNRIPQAAITRAALDEMRGGGGTVLPFVLRGEEAEAE